MEGNTIGKRLKAARGKMTQADVCDKLGIPSVQTLSAYERDVNSPTVDTLKKLSMLYKVSTDWLLFGSECSAQNEKDPLHYLSSLVEAIDYFSFAFSGESPPGSYGNQISIDLCSTDYSAIDRFAGEWMQLRKLRDGHILSKEDYEILLKKRFDTLDFSETKLPF